MYIAGLYLSHAQGIESIVCLTTAAQIFIASCVHKASVKRGEAAGPVVRSPTSLTGRIITPIHGASTVVPTLVYFVSVIANALVQPGWIQRWRLPDIGVREEAWLRTAACVAALGISRVLQITFSYLGKQFHFIGVREKPSVVSTGPYGIVRHPVYSALLAQMAISAVMFWSYVPLISLGITAVAFAVKVPIEEKLILDSPIGPDYAQYQKKVPYRVIPYIW